MEMPKKQELATEGVKLNYTPSELEIIDAAAALDDERKRGTWIRKASLRVARERLAEAAAAEKKSGRR